MGKEQKILFHVFTNQHYFHLLDIENLIAGDLKMFTMLHELINKQGMQITAAKQCSYTAFLSMQKQRFHA